MQFSKVLVLSGIVATAALGAVSPAMANCQPTQEVVRINNVNSRVQRVTYTNGAGTVVQQRTVVVPTSRAW